MRYFALGIVSSFVDGWDWKYWGCDILHLWGDKQCVTHTTTALQGTSCVAHSQCSFVFHFKVGRALYKNTAINHCNSLVINRYIFFKFPKRIIYGLPCQYIFRDTAFEHREHMGTYTAEVIHLNVTFMLDSSSNFNM